MQVPSRTPRPAPSRTPTGAALRPPRAPPPLPGARRSIPLPRPLVKGGGVISLGELRTAPASTALSTSRCGPQELSYHNPPDCQIGSQRVRDVSDDRVG